MVSAEHLVELLRQRSMSHSHLEQMISASVAGQQALLAGQRATRLLANICANNGKSDNANMANGQQQKVAKSLPHVQQQPDSQQQQPQQSHGTSAGFCAICKKYVSNRTNHKYVHSQVRMASTVVLMLIILLVRCC